MLAAAAAADLARAPAASRPLLEAAGGFGTGGALDFSRCPEDLDPRVEPRCADRVGPFPSGGAPCRRHVAAGPFAR